MKPLTVELPDDVYKRAEQRAAQRGASLPGEAAELIKRYSERGDEEVSDGFSKAWSKKGLLSAGMNEVVEELVKIAEECRTQNWDGYGAAPVSQDTLSHAVRFVQALPQGYPLPSVGVEPDGHLTLEWYRNPSWTLSLSVSPEADLY